MLRNRYRKRFRLRWRCRLSDQSFAKFALTIISHLAVNVAANTNRVGAHSVIHLILYIELLVENKWNFNS